MATKAELETELAALRAEVETLAKDRSSAPRSESERDVGDDHEGGTPPDHVAALHKLLRECGIDHDEIESLWKQFSSELEDLQQHKPVFLALGAFALGFVLGRSSK